MTAGMDKPAHQTQREEYPEIAERLGGDDPARWLDRDFLEQKGAWTVTEEIVKSLPDARHVALWLQVEHQLDRGPRDAVVDALDKRRRAIDVGDYREHLDALPKADPPSLKSNAVWERPDGDTTDGRDRGPFIPGERPCLERWRERQERRQEIQDAHDEDAPSVGLEGEPDVAVTDGGYTCGCGADLSLHDLNGLDAWFCPECAEFRDVPEGES